jgi:hypothetical protein
VPDTASGVIRTADGRRVKRNGPTKRRKRAEIEQPELWS